MSTAMIQSVLRTLLAAYASKLAPGDYEAIVQALSVVLVAAWGAYNAYSHKKVEAELKAKALVP